MPGLEIAGHLTSRQMKLSNDSEIEIHDTYISDMPPNLIENSGSTISSITTSDGIWTIWNAQYASTVAITATNIASNIISTSSIINSNLIWGTWNTSYTTNVIYTSTGTSGSVIWDNWNQEYTSNGVSFVRNQETEEQQRERASREEAYRQRIIEDEAKRAEAKKKAEELLRGNLSPEQLRDLQERNFFTVFSRDGQRKYRIDRGRSRNVRLLDENNRVIRTYCAHPGPAIPDADTMLAQKLLIESDEQSFLRVANVS